MFQRIKTEALAKSLSLAMPCQTDALGGANIQPNFGRPELDVLLFDSNYSIPPRTGYFRTKTPK